MEFKQKGGSKMTRFEASEMKSSEMKSKSRKETLIVGFSESVGVEERRKIRSRRNSHFMASHDVKMQSRAPRDGSAPGTVLHDRRRACHGLE